KKTVQRLVGIESISKSQLSRKNGDIPPEIFQIILHHLIQKLHQVLGPKKAEKALRKLNLIDSSTISMCISQYELSDLRETKARVKMNTSSNFCDGISYPNNMIPTPSRPADETQLGALSVPYKDGLTVFDPGYFNFIRCDVYCDNGIRFVA